MTLYISAQLNVHLIFCVIHVTTGLGHGGNKTVRRQDNSLTRFLKTVHRQI